MQLSLKDHGSNAFIIKRSEKKWDFLSKNCGSNLISVQKIFEIMLLLSKERGKNVIFMKEAWEKHEFRQSITEKAYNYNLGGLPSPLPSFCCSLWEKFLQISDIFFKTQNYSLIFVINLNIWIKISRIASYRNANDIFYVQYPGRK